MLEIHFDTVAVESLERSMSTKVLELSESISTLHYQAEVLENAWSGPGADEFCEIMQRLTRQMRQSIDELDNLRVTARFEVVKWTAVDRKRYS